MDQQLFEQIEAYIQNTMSVEEKAAFEQQLDKDPSLRKEVNLQLELTNAIETEAMQTALQEIHQQKFHSVSEKNLVSLARRLRPLAVAASIALLTLAAWWLFRNTGDFNDRLFTQYYDTPAGLPTSLGVQDNPVFEEGMIDYKLRDFENARQKWRPLLNQFPANDTLRFFMGVTFLETQQVDSAIIQFQELLRSEKSGYRQPAQWLLGLSLIAGNREQDAIPILEELSQADNPFRENAKTVLAKLK